MFRSTVENRNVKPESVGTQTIIKIHSQTGIPEISKYQESIFLDVKTKEKPGSLVLSDSQIKAFISYLSVDSRVGRAIGFGSTAPTAAMIFVTPSDVTISKTILDAANLPLLGQGVAKQVAVYQAVACDHDSLLSGSGYYDMIVGRYILLNEEVLAKHIIDPLYKLVEFSIDYSARPSNLFLKDNQSKDISNENRNLESELDLTGQITIIGDFPPSDPPPPDNGVCFDSSDYPWSYFPCSASAATDEPSDTINWGFGIGSDYLS